MCLGPTTRGGRSLGFGFEDEDGTAWFSRMARPSGAAVFASRVPVFRSVLEPHRLLACALVRENHAAPHRPLFRRQDERASAPGEAVRLVS